VAERANRLVAYIPARGGSKRVPGKNIRRLGGVPVLARVIDSIRRSGVARAICVSTDDPETAAIARERGALVLEPRARALAGDRATFMDLLRRDLPRHLERLGLAEGEAEVLFALATAALVPPAVYRDAYRRFRRERPDILVATSRLEHSPYRALARTPGGRWAPLFPRMLSARTQDLPEARRDAGLFYFMRYAPMARLRGHWFEARRLACFPAPEAVAVDVDAPSDWRTLEARYRELRRP
jgi:pseudaminic acid cytidylyltransferase